jgi:hypothetical protein
VRVSHRGTNDRLKLVFEIINVPVMASSYAPNQWAKMRPKDVILDKMRNLSRCRVCYAEITQIFRMLGVKRPKSYQQRIALEFHLEARRPLHRGHRQG